VCSGIHVAEYSEGVVCFVKLLANSFHKTAYFERIEEALFNQYVLEKLSVPSYMSQRRNLDGTSITMEASNHEKERKLLDAVASKAVSSLAFNNILRFVRHTNIRTVSTQNVEMKTEEQAEYFGKDIFRNIAPVDSEIIRPGHLEGFLDEKDLDRLFQLIEVKEDGTVTIEAFVDWVREVVKERKYLSMTLSDTKTAIKSLDDLLNYGVAFVLVIIVLIIFKVNMAKLMVVTSSSLLAAVFVFGNTCKNVFESIVFLFVVHPYDTGDVIIVKGAKYQVEEMQLLTTILLSSKDNSKVYMSNTKLAQIEIVNLYRSPDMTEVLELQVDCCTPGDKLDALRDRVSRFALDNPDQWQPKAALSITEVLGNKLVMHLSLQMKMNFCKGDVRCIYRNRLVMNVMKGMSELGIPPSGDISVRML
jgi:small-conductance mechanosensitive channel